MQPGLVVCLCNPFGLVSYFTIRHVSVNRVNLVLPDGRKAERFSRNWGLFVSEFDPDIRVTLTTLSAFPHGKRPKYDANALPFRTRPKCRRTTRSNARTQGNVD